MKIVLMITDLLLGKGGAERVGAELSNEMNLRGHEVSVLSHLRNNELAYPLSSKVNHIITSISESTMKNVENIVRDIDPDVYFFFNTGTTLISHSKIANNIKIPYSFQECTNPIRAVNNISRLLGVENLEEAYKIRQAFVAGAARVRLVMESYLDYSPPLAKNNCIAFTNAFKRCDKKATLVTTERKRIICVNGLKNFNKGGILLAFAFARLTEKFPDWQLDFYGKISRDVKPVLPQFTNHPINFHGVSNNIYDAYAESQIHVICSLEEGCPNVVCEAMLHGIPSIGFDDCMGTNELIKHNKNGILIPRSETDIGKLTTALSQLMGNDELRLRLGNQAFLDSKKFDSVLTYNAWEKFFNEAASYKNNPDRIYADQMNSDPVKAELYQKIRNEAWEKHGYNQLSVSP